MIENRPASIPNFVTAGSPQGLRRRMLMNNARLGSFVHYYDIQSYKDAKGVTVFIAWFFENVSNNDPIFEPKAGE